MRDAIAGIIIGFVLGSGLPFFLEWRASRPRRHEFRGNYFDARAPFEIRRVGGPVEERSDARVDKVARRLGRLRARRWADGDTGASARH